MATAVNAIGRLVGSAFGVQLTSSIVAASANVGIGTTRASLVIAAVVTGGFFVSLFIPAVIETRSSPLAVATEGT